MIIITRVVVSYKNADLDGVACAYAYAEFLNKTGHTAGYYIKMPVQKEVSIVCSLFNIKLQNTNYDLNTSEISVVDTNTLSAVDFVPAERIIEIIDHHPISGDDFGKAELKLYKLGAICTLIAEYFRDNNLNVSRESAILLYYGIISNTVYFNANITTKRDREMASWLKDQCSEIDEKLIDVIFEKKSAVDLNNLRFEMEVEEKFYVGSYGFVIGQLEITKAAEFLMNNKNAIDDIFEDVKKEFNVSLVFINIVDILKGYHIIYTPSFETERFFLNHYGLKFNKGIIREERYMLRKEIKMYMRKNFK